MEDNSNLVLPEIIELILQHFDPTERMKALLASSSFYLAICRLGRNQTLKLDETMVSFKKN